MFDLTEEFNQDISSFDKWNLVIEQLDCSTVDLSEYPAWTKFVNGIASDGTTIKNINKINGFVNKLIKYTSDDKAWGELDYWASPVEVLSRRKGDCEDFAILKYYTLKYIGFSPDSMRLVIVRQNRGPMHAVMSIEYESRIYILDNQLTMVVEDSKLLNKYTPIYSINENGWWRHS